MKQGDHDSKKRIAFPIQLFAEEGSALAVPDEINVVPTGKWMHPVYGEMEITSADIAEFVQNFKDKVRLDLPITAGHDNGMSGGELPAIGWFTDLIDRGVNGLNAVVKWTDVGKRLLQEGAFKYFSPEFYEEYADPETGEVRHHVLVGGALTNKPYFKELEPVVAFSEPAIMNQFNEPMDLKDIVAKKVEDLTADEKAFVREHKAELDADQQSAFASVIEDASTETDEEKAAREAKGAEDKAAADKAAADAAASAEAERQASERNKGKLITMSAAEHAELTRKANEGATALQKIEASERDALVMKMIFSDTNKVGKFSVKQKGAVESFVKTLSEKQRDQFVNLVNNLPKPDASLFSELGDGGSSNGSDINSVVKEFDEAVKAAITASNGKLKYSDAVRKVFAEKPELKQNYDAALAEGSN